MLVEFHNDEVMGLTLLVSQKEYSKAAKSDDELESLRTAINAYMILQGFKYLELDDELYGIIRENMTTDSFMIIATSITNTVPERLFFRILVTSKGKQKVIVVFVGDSYQVVV